MVKYSTVADIGTDHGHLPVFMVQNGMVHKVLATDVNPGPLACARRNIAAEGLEDFVLTSLCDGLDGVNPAEYAACVISGMGGRLTIDILQRNMDCARSFKQLVLSPQRDVSDVRLFLHQRGFRIDDEEILEEKGKFYNILDVSFGFQTPYDEKGYIFGEILLRKRSETFKRFVEKEISKISKINRSEQERYLQLCEEVLACPRK
jgi:tRNA (adenine22-N1)-methyltransferase